MSISRALALVALSLVLTSAFAEDSKVKQDAKEAGKTVGTAARDAGHGAKKASKDVGKAVSTAARETGHAFRDGAKAFGKEFNKAVKGESGAKKSKSK